MVDDARATSTASPATKVGVTILAAVEMLLGGVVLYWSFAQGVRDESSLGTMAFVWGATAGFGLLIPGLLLLVLPSPFRWFLQVYLAVLATLFVVNMLFGVVTY